jgi:hypothetical protein
MAKYYVESGQVRVVFDADNTTEAAVKAFQWTCDRQSGIEADSPLDHLLEAEYRGWQLEDEIRVSEIGFGRPDAEIYPTLDVVAIWQGALFPWTR